MPSHRAPAILSLLLALTIALTACGGDSGLDTNNPRDVARAYYVAGFNCGEEGAGAQYDLSTSPNRTWSRDTFLKLQRRDGCRPRQAPELVVALLNERDDFAAVEISPRGNGSVTYNPGRYLLVRVKGSWKVDTSRSVEPEEAA